MRLEQGIALSVTGRFAPKPFSPQSFRPWSFRPLQRVDQNDKLIHQKVLYIYRGSDKNLTKSRKNLGIQNLEPGTSVKTRQFTKSTSKIKLYYSAENNIMWKYSYTYDKAVRNPTRTKRIATSLSEMNACTRKPCSSRISHSLLPQTS